MRRSFLFIFLVLLGCSRGQNQKSAVDALNKELKRDTVNLPLTIGRVSRQCAPIPGLVETSDLTKVVEYAAAQKAGLIAIRDDGPGFWKVELVNPNPKFAAALQKAKHNVDGGCDYLHVGLGLAYKTVVDIVNLQQITDAKAEAVFNWKWALEPDGVKLVDNLTEQERIQLSPHIERTGLRRPDPTFVLADLSASTSPHQDKKTLKKSGDGWTLEE